MACSPEVATAPTGVISTCGASEEDHLSCDPSPQLSSALLADNSAVGLATATVAVAVPAAKRARVLSFSPRGHGTVFRTPFGISRTTRWLTGTSTAPDQISLPFRPRIVTW